MGGGSGGRTGEGGEDDEDAEPQFLTVVRQEFVFQFVWKPKSFSERLKMQEEAAEQEALEAESQEVAMN